MQARGLLQRRTPCMDALCPEEAPCRGSPCRETLVEELAAKRVGMHGEETLAEEVLCGNRMPLVEDTLRTDGRPPAERPSAQRGGGTL